MARVPAPRNPHYVLYGDGAAAVPRPVEYHQAHRHMLEALLLLDVRLHVVVLLSSARSSIWPDLHACCAAQSVTSHDIVCIRFRRRSHPPTYLRPWPASRGKPRSASNGYLHNTKTNPYFYRKYPQLLHRNDGHTTQKQSIYARESNHTGHAVRTVHDLNTTITMYGITTTHTIHDFNTTITMYGSTTTYMDSRLRHKTNDLLPDISQVDRE